MKEISLSSDYKITRYEIQEMSEIRDLPYYITPNSRSAAAAGTIKLSKY